MDKNISGLSMQKIIDKTVNVLEESKKDIFSIGEAARKDEENTRKELENINEEINDLINRIDRLEKRNRKARIKLMHVSSDFYNSTEEDIKKAYSEAENSSIEIAVLQEKEDQLKNQRNTLEQRIIKIKDTVKMAENLVTKVSIMHEYLLGELSSLSDQYDDLKQKQLMMVKVIEAQEEERKRVAREIHDGPAQSLANLVFRVEVVEKMMDYDSEKALVELHNLKSMIRGSVQDVRKIIYDLRPMSLDDLGLLPTLKRYIDKYQQQTNITINMEIIGNQRRLASTYEVTIFRLTQEALNNIYKHSQATRGGIRLKFGKNLLHLNIFDNGKGFNKDDINHENNFGLISMQERCALLGGKIDIESSKSGGTKINITLPINEEGGR